jgi:hypothetical protein
MFQLFTSHYQAEELKQWDGALFFIKSAIAVQCIPQANVLAQSNL